jgi:fido (protein-threonine AMPylation protein)
LFDGYEIDDEQGSQNQRASYWQAGIGLQQVDGLTVSDELIEQSQLNIQGLIGYDAIEQQVIDRYRGLDLSNAGIMEGFEADLVATRIARLLSKNDFFLSRETLKSIHRQLFQGLELFDDRLAPGIFKTQNWRKSERILYGQSVHYGSADAVEGSLSEVIERERTSSYQLPLGEDDAHQIADFCTQVWLIHPFSEGNTRTVAVFIEKYLRSMGVEVDNSQFEKHSAWFRDALVRSCFMDAQNGVAREPAFLQRFFENLLSLANHQFSFAELYVEQLKQ